MSISSREILLGVRLYFLDESQKSKDFLAEKAATYLGEYSLYFMDFLRKYCADYPNRPLNTNRFYTVFIRSLAVKICQKAAEESNPIQRIPMLSELEKAIDAIGYSFTMLRGTSHLCEVQIQPK